MVYIHSRQEDITTITFIEWCLFYGKKFRRVKSVLEFIDDINISLDNELQEKDMQSIYAHGGGYGFMLPFCTDLKLNDKINKHLGHEYKALFSFYIKKILGKKNIKHFGNIIHSDVVNKLETLTVAQSIGFTIPDTAIISSKKWMKHYQGKWPEAIMKSIENGLSAYGDIYMITGQPTELLAIDDANVEDTFLPSLIQESIAKKYEIKSCYVNGKILSVAIFSQQEQASRYDSRNINPVKPVRIVPYKIPLPIENKIMVLMDKLGYNYGTIDLIFSTADVYYFLEVNPHGQFSTISSIGNYNIELEIFNYLNSLHEAN